MIGPNKFADLERLYQRTKPVSGSRRKKEFDIRPVLSRSNFWTRIIKANDNKYLIAVRDYWAYNPDMYTKPSMEVYQQVAPLIWERNEEMEIVTFRVTVQNLSETRALFNVAFTGYGDFEFVTKGQKSYIKVDDTEYYLPRSRVTMRHNSSGPFGYQTENVDKDVTLKFARKHGEDRWQCLSVKHADYKTVVNKEAKKPYVNGMRKLREYCGRMAAMDQSLPRSSSRVFDWQQMNALRSRLRVIRDDLAKEIGDEFIKQSDKKHSAHCFFEVMSNDSVSWSMRLSTEHEVKYHDLGNAPGSSSDWLKDQMRDMLLMEYPDQHWLAYYIYKMWLIDYTGNMAQLTPSQIRSALTRLTDKINHAAGFMHTVIV